jgi:polysaccharide pyruvyl transferase WcaK-like protein
LLDLIIVGSDQVWNTHLTNGFDDYYWGNLNIREDARIISYAASIEEYWYETYNTKAKNLLNKFNAISVREQKTAEYLRIFLDKDINVTIDPTLLVDSSVWEKFAQKPSLADNYLLFYQVRNSPECESYAEEISKKLGLRLIVLSARVDQANSKECIDSSPEEFVGWFKYASYVICTSFHGTVFSVIFKRPFVSIKLGDGKNDRVESFLKSIDLSERLIEVNTTVPSINIDWDKVNLRLSKQQTKSRQYLENFIS